MAISYKKINSMIEQEVSILDISERDKRLLTDLCTKIYLIESSLDSANNTKVLDDIRGEITRKADMYQVEK